MMKTWFGVMVVCVAMMCVACEKEAATPSNTAAQTTATDEVKPAAETMAKDTTAKETTAKETTANAVAEVPAEKIEQISETCAKLDEPGATSCAAFLVELKAKKPEAIAQVDVVIEGTRVKGNMVYLDEAVVEMLTEKFGGKK